MNILFANLIIGIPTPVTSAVKDVYDEGPLLPLTLLVCIIAFFLAISIKVLKKLANKQ